MYVLNELDTSGQEMPLHIDTDLDVGHVMMHGPEWIHAQFDTKFLEKKGKMIGIDGMGFFSMYAGDGQ